MEKTAEDDGPPPTFPDHREIYEVLKGRVPGHHNFGQRVCVVPFLRRQDLTGIQYFERLKPRVEAVESPPAVA